MGHLFLAHGWWKQTERRWLSAKGPGLVVNVAKERKIGQVEKSREKSREKKERNDVK